MQKEAFAEAVMGKRSTLATHSQAHTHSAVSARQLFAANSELSSLEVPVLLLVLLLIKKVHSAARRIKAVVVIKKLLASTCEHSTKDTSIDRIRRAKER